MRTRRSAARRSTYLCSTYLRSATTAAILAAASVPDVGSAKTVDEPFTLA